MTISTSVSFQDMPSSPALISDIERHIEQLQRFAPDITSCRVTVKRSEHVHHKGNRYEVLVHLTVPGGELDAGHTTAKNRTHQDAYAAAHDAFDMMRRRLQDFVRVRRGEVKSHTVS